MPRQRKLYRGPKGGFYFIKNGRRNYINPQSSFGRQLFGMTRSRFGAYNISAVTELKENLIQGVTQYILRRKQMNEKQKNTFKQGIMNNTIIAVLTDDELCGKDCKCIEDAISVLILSPSDFNNNNKLTKRQKNKASEVGNSILKRVMEKLCNENDSRSKSSSRSGGIDSLPAATRARIAALAIDLGRKDASYLEGKEKEFYEEYKAYIDPLIPKKKEGTSGSSERSSRVVGKLGDTGLSLSSSGRDIEKYKRMKKMGLPEDVLRNAMMRDGIPKIEHGGILQEIKTTSSTLEVADNIVNMSYEDVYKKLEKLIPGCLDDHIKASLVQKGQIINNIKTCIIESLKDELDNEKEDSE